MAFVFRVVKRYSVTRVEKRYRIVPAGRGLYLWPPLSTDTTTQAPNMLVSVIDSVALAKQGDNTLGVLVSVPLSVRLSPCPWPISSLRYLSMPVRDHSLIIAW